MTKEKEVQQPLSGLIDRTTLPGYEDLETLALDMRWSWNHGADLLWQDLDKELWDSTHNPWVVLQTVSVETLKAKLADTGFQDTLGCLMHSKREQDVSETWFHKQHGDDKLSCVAYFSMEYMLSESLPIYSGGLGNVAGDQLKAASDLGVPVVAVGLLYQQGYFRQIVDHEGVQQALYPYNDPGQLPITPLRKKNGEWLRLEIPFPGYSVWIRTWQVRVGRVRLLLLDSNDAGNFPAYRAVTSELYGGGSDLRLKQEILLGLLGWRLLEKLEMKPEVCHLNEGHAAFAVVERAKSYMASTGLTFEEALAVTKGGNVFTTHTAVPAGFDRYPQAMIEQYLTEYVKSLGIKMKEFMALGRENADDPNEPFNMAYLAIRGSSAVNGVSQLHSQVSQRLFEPLFPHWPQHEIPVGYVTNGIHVPSWVSTYAGELWGQIYRKDRCGLWTIDFNERCMDHITDGQLWEMRNKARLSLVEYTRRRLTRQVAARGVPEEEIAIARSIFDEHTLTLGFARRFATYKRPNMLLHDPERLLGILTNPQRPVQLIIAGKAHPADKPGQALIKQWVQFSHQNKQARAHVIFLSDYDMLVTERMVGGVDAWVNTPRRPWEACGTSGMKVLSNGGLNISELDGWWVEAYCPEVGWAIGDAKEHGEDAVWDEAEAKELYRILEEEVIPTFYRRDKEGIPTEWVAKMRRSMSRLTPQFSANRSVRDYTEKYYLPAVSRYRKRAEENGRLGKAIVQWKRSLDMHWEKVRFCELTVTTKNEKYIVETQIYLDGIDPSFVKVEVYSDPFEGQEGWVGDMSFVRSLPASPSCYLYSAEVPNNRPERCYTARIIPYLDGTSVPLEENRVLWQK